MKFKFLILASSLYVVACSSIPKTPKYQSGFLKDYTNFISSPNEDKSKQRSLTNYFKSELKKQLSAKHPWK